MAQYKLTCMSHLSPYLRTSSIYLISIFSINSWNDTHILVTLNTGNTLPPLFIKISLTTPPFLGPQQFGAIELDYKGM